MGFGESPDDVRLSGFRGSIAESNYRAIIDLIGIVTQLSQSSVSHHRISPP